MLLDLVYAHRLLKKSPIATTVTILALALGIGANIGSFVATNALLLHPFPYLDLDRIVMVWGSLPKQELNHAGVTAADFDDWKQQARSFEALTSFAAGQSILPAAIVRSQFRQRELAGASSRSSGCNPALAGSSRKVRMNSRVMSRS